MRELIFLLLLATSLPQHNAHCPFMPGIQMPASGKLTLYFRPSFLAKPECFVDLGEAQLNVTAGFVSITGKPNTRVDIRCIEVNQ